MPVAAVAHQLRQGALPSGLSTLMSSPVWHPISMHPLALHAGLQLFLMPTPQALVACM